MDKKTFSDDRKTSAQIISEARHAINKSPHPVVDSLHTIQTQRPFTPRDKERHLFGNKSKNGDRPPSSFSLRYLQNDSDLPTYNVDTNLILSPTMLTATSDQGAKAPPLRPDFVVSEMSTNKIFNIKDIPMRKIRLPSLDRPFPKKKLIRKNSLENLPEEAEDLKLQSRNAFSSPQERTEYTEQNWKSPFGRPSKRQDLSGCLLLGPRNLEKIFDNREIIEHSTTLFAAKGYFNCAAPTPQSQNVSECKTVEDALNNLNFATNDQAVIRQLDELYEKIDLKIDSKLKIQMLKTLYKHVESENQEILLGIARIILAIKVTGNNLTGVCKLLFKVAKNDCNDYLFLKKNIIELFLDTLGRSSPLDDTEACVYGYGAVKCLSMNNQLQQKLISLGILELMALHMKIINTAKTDRVAMSEQTNHALFQLTAALRNLASEDSIYDRFNTSGATAELCVTMEIFAGDPDVIGNISRTLSIISTSEACCDKIVEVKNIYRIFVDAFGKYSGTEEIIVRLTYTVGNIVAKIDQTRELFYKEQNFVDVLLDLWKIYLERTLKNCSLTADGKSSEDVMVKVIRIVANIVINPDIGKIINERYGTKLIDEFLKVLISNPFKKNHELVLSILSTLNNLSYYHATEPDQDIFHVRQVEMIEGVAEYAKSRNKECIVESMRILGNLSRSKISRTYILENEIFQTLIEALDNIDHLVLKTTIGVFVNLMADGKSRTLFKSKNGVGKVIKILKQYGQSDWLLGTLICQVLWNYSIDCVDLYELFTNEEIQKLLVLLADYLDDEKLFGIKDDVEDSDVFASQEYMIWDEFATVATNLLEKIEYFLDTFDEIDISNAKIETKDNGTSLSFAAW